MQLHNPHQVQESTNQSIVRTKEKTERLAEMRNVNLVGDLESFCSPKLSPLFPDRIFFIIITIIAIITLMGRSGGIAETFGSAIVGGKHLHLAQMWYFDHYSVIVNWEGLFPGFPVDPHKCVVSCPLVKFKPDSVCLHWRKENFNGTKDNIRGLFESSFRKGIVILDSKKASLLAFEIPC